MTTHEQIEVLAREYLYADYPPRVIEEILEIAIQSPDARDYYGIKDPSKVMLGCAYEADIRADAIKSPEAAEYWLNKAIEAGNQHKEYIRKHTSEESNIRLIGVDVIEDYQEAMKHLNGKRLCNWPEYQFLTDLEAAVLDEISPSVLDKAGITLAERQKLAESLINLIRQQIGRELLDPIKSILHEHIYKGTEETYAELKDAEQELEEIFREVCQMEEKK